MARPLLAQNSWLPYRLIALPLVGDLDWVITNDVAAFRATGRFKLSPRAETIGTLDLGFEFVQDGATVPPNSNSTIDVRSVELVDIPPFTASDGTPVDRSTYLTYAGDGVQLRGESRLSVLDFRFAVPELGMRVTAVANAPAAATHILLTCRYG